MNFRSQIDTRWREAQSLLCVGLDPDPNRLPMHLRPSPGAAEANSAASHPRAALPALHTAMRESPPRTFFLSPGGE